MPEAVGIEESFAVPLFTAVLTETVEPPVLAPQAARPIGARSARDLRVRRMLNLHVRGLVRH